MDHWHHPSSGPELAWSTWSPAPKLCLECQHHPPSSSFFFLEFRQLLIPSALL